MVARKEPVRLCSLGDELAGVLFLPPSPGRWPVLIVCHGAGEFKEHYFELCEWLVQRGIAALALDMHGHGQSQGERFHVNMRQWVADIRAAIDFLLTHPEINGQKVGAFGLSSGGTAILEAAVVEPRLRALVALEATVRPAGPWPLRCALRVLVVLGQLKKWLSKQDLRLPLARMGQGVRLAVAPEIDQQLRSDPRILDAFMAFPFPGAAQAFFVNTLRRVSQIAAPTLVLWGAEDELDPPETARLLYEALRCKKCVHIIPGNGHLGHLDRHRDQVFALTTDWVLENLA